MDFILRCTDAEIQNIKTERQQIAVGGRLGAAANIASGGLSSFTNASTSLFTVRRELFSPWTWGFSY
jgi:hypothetical protein